MLQPTKADETRMIISVSEEVFNLDEELKQG